MNHDQPPPGRCGYVALAGRPNVGKSTLLNQLVGQKISITSRRPQTTRHRLLGIKTRLPDQIIYVDTPGLHQNARRALNRYMNRAASGSLQDVDMVVFLVEALRWQPEDDYVLSLMRASRVPVILAVNKIDQARPREKLLPYLEQVSGKMAFGEIYPLSALKGDNLEQLEQGILRLLPPGQRLFPEDQITDRGERFFAAELIREKLITRLGDELPYRLSVEIENFRDDERLSYIDAVIWVEKRGHKPIVIGRQGQLLKNVGTLARQEMEHMLGRKVFLQLWVKVREDWSDDEQALRRMGYGE